MSEQVFLLSHKAQVKIDHQNVNMLPPHSKEGMAQEVGLADHSFDRLSSLDAILSDAPLPFPQTPPQKMTVDKVHHA